ncbi:MAG TPA: OsmC family protein [Thermoanaerobaculia bacterium]|nr:OsmC family protein [Thermoanaerobaculia bacterium]
MYTAKIKTVGESMARSMTDVRNFKIFQDEPPELGGRDGAPSPLELILAAHGGCLSYMTFFIGKELGIDVKGTEIEVEASLDPGKFAGTNRNVRAGYQAVNVTIKVHADASPEDLEKLKQEVETRCPVSDNIANSTPVNISMTAAAQPQPAYLEAAMA